MGRPYSNDLRRKILEAYGRGGVSLAGLAEQFGVSYGYTKKLRKQQLRSGRMERVPQRHGGRRRATAKVQARLREMIRQQPDLTLGVENECARLPQPDTGARSRWWER